MQRYRDREAQTHALVEEFEELSDAASDDEDAAAVQSVWLDVQDSAADCMTLCGFRPAHFLELFMELEAVLADGVGRGRRPETSAHDRLLMLFVYLKHYETYKKLGVTFRVSQTQAMRIVETTARAVLPVLWRNYVETLDVHDVAPYPEFPDAIAMMDATVQPIWTPTAEFGDKKRYFSGKHKMYVLKSQCVHDLKGRVVHVVVGVPGATSDITIAQQSVASLRRILKRNAAGQFVPAVVPHPAAAAAAMAPPVVFDEDEEIIDVVGNGGAAAAAAAGGGPANNDSDSESDNEESDEEEPEELAMIVDKGYQGLQHFVPCVMPHKRRANAQLTQQQKQHNRRVARRRVLVENYYARFKRRNRIMADKYRGERDEYQLYFKLCVALTNFHVIKFPLRAE
jgi:hypothetical protein